ncbi:hypothetical protein D3C78_734870 [compost metagenome]
MRPAGLREEQPTSGQTDTGDALGLVARQGLQQRLGEGRRELRLALALGLVEGQLQHAAGVPLAAALQALQQPAGVAEAAHHQPRQRRAVGRQLEIEHALRIA